MRTLTLLLCFIALSFGCKKQGPNTGWEIYKFPKSSKDHHKWAPKIKSITLIDISEIRFTLTAPFTPNEADTTPENAFKRISILNDRARQTGLKTYWYVLQITNLRQKGKWAMLISNPRIQEVVFIKRQEDSTFIKIDGTHEHEPNYIEPVGRRYLLNLNGNFEATLLLKISSTEPTFLKEVKIFALDQSGKYQETNDKKFGITLGILGLLILIFFYFFVASKDFSHLIFIFYAVFETAQYLSGLNRMLFPFLWYDFTRLGANALTFVLLYLTPADRKSTKLNLSFITLIILHILTMQGFWYLGVFIGQNWQFTLRIALHIFLAYSFWIAWKQKLGKNWCLLVAFSGSFLTLFYLPIGSSYFLPSRLWDNEVIINLFYLFGKVGVYVAIIYLLLSRFGKYRRLQAEQRIALAIRRDKEISAKVIAAQEEERERISKDLHDEIGGNLALIKIKLHNLNFKHDALEEVATDLNKISMATKAIAYQLMPPYFQQTDFKMLLFSHFNQLNEKGSMNFHLNFVGQLEMSKEKELMLYRIILEMVQNCIRHSMARHVEVGVIANNDKVEISCADDGTGFSSDAKAGIGINSIQSRVEYLNGILKIESGPEGTTLKVVIPKSKS